jgi:hypothetical protein
MMTRKGALRTLGLALMLGGIGLAGAACEDNDGPVENAAEEVDEAAEDAAEAVEDAVD